jgi:hypothetical protein
VGVVAGELYRKFLKTTLMFTNPCTHEPQNGILEGSKTKTTPEATCHTQSKA